VETLEKEKGKETNPLNNNNNNNNNNNSTQELVGNEENGYQAPDLKKRMINVRKKPGDTHKKTLKEEILKEMSEKHMEKTLEMVKRNLQDALKKFQDAKLK
jgi:hypothetical protein